MITVIEVLHGAQIRDAVAVAIGAACDSQVAGDLACTVTPRTYLWWSIVTRDAVARSGAVDDPPSFIPR